MSKYPTNQDRTNEYLSKFNRELVIKKLLGIESPMIFDIGANDGSSILEFKKWWPDSIVHSFEPQKECWPKLESLKAKYPDSLYINNQAVGNQEKKKSVFYTHDVSSGIAGFNKVNFKSNDSISLQKVTNLSHEEKVKYKSSFNRPTEVNVIRLDEYISEHTIHTVDLLKIDTQGYEPEVLDGLGSCLESVRVVLTELMLYDYYDRSLSFSDIEKFLLPCGFQLFDISHISKNPMNGRTDWVDLIYVNKKIT